MPNGILVDPFVNFNFLVELDGITTAAFQECTGFDSSVDVVEYNEGGSLSPRKIPGMVKYANIVLKKGMTSDLQLYQWHLTVAQGSIQRKNGSIVLLDRAGNPVARWDFMQAWPTKYNSPDLNAQGTSTIAIENFELVCELVTRVQ
jgi:phage tail-like protein